MYLQKSFKIMQQIASPSTHKWTPPPAIVFTWKLKVCQSDGDTGCDIQKDNKHYEKYSIQGVLFTAPQCGKDVVQLHRDCTAEKVSTIIFLMIHVESGVASSHHST